ncbi:uncharacterized protein LOC120897352 [Anopheles arabiensis]|uniref:uncharacterized protein LOC120897352 n=1 Tax=Anopheles arabiensis TaxID=7173 RepID=UPI001AAC7783|nr:uncharacterized protein LOC120897352 [Anopheles arabiensis]
MLCEVIGKPYGSGALDAGEKRKGPQREEILSSTCPGVGGDLNESQPEKEGRLCTNCFIIYGLKVRSPTAQRFDSNQRVLAGIVRLEQNGLNTAVQSLMPSLSTTLMVPQIVRIDNDTPGNARFLSDPAQLTVSGR